MQMAAVAAAGAAGAAAPLTSNSNLNTNSTDMDLDSKFAPAYMIFVKLHDRKPNPTPEHFQLFKTHAARLDAHLKVLERWVYERQEHAKQEMKQQQDNKIIATFFVRQQQGGYTPPPKEVHDSGTATTAGLMGDVYRYARNLLSDLKDFIENKFDDVHEDGEEIGEPGWPFANAMDFHVGRVLRSAKELNTHQTDKLKLPASDLSWFTDQCQALLIDAQKAFPSPHEWKHLTEQEFMAMEATTGTDARVANT